MTKEYTFHVSADIGLEVEEDDEDDEDDEFDMMDDENNDDE